MCKITELMVENMPVTVAVFKPVLLICGEASQSRFQWNWIKQSIQLGTALLPHLINPSRETANST